jgi:hypothetical protein
MPQKNKRNVCKKLSELEFAFLGGVFTGDSSFTKTALGIQLTDLTIVEYVANQLQTKITIYESTKNPQFKPVYRTFLTRRFDLYYILTGIYPFLSNRRTKLTERLLFNISNPKILVTQPLPNQVIPLEQNKPVLLHRDCTEMEFAWLAGYFLSEGHIYIDKRPVIPYPSIVFETTEKDLIEYTSILLCKSYFPQKRKTTAGNVLYKTKLNRRVRLRYIFEGILPYLKSFPDVQTKVKEALQLLDKLDK